MSWGTVKKVFISWVAAPCFTAFISFTFYTPVKYFIMQHENSFDRAVHAFPIVVFVVSVWLLADDDATATHESDELKHVFFFLRLHDRVSP